MFPKIPRDRLLEGNQEPGQSAAVGRPQGLVIHLKKTNRGLLRETGEFSFLVYPRVKPYERTRIKAALLGSCLALTALTEVVLPLERVRSACLPVLPHARCSSIPREAVS